MGAQTIAAALPQMAAQQPDAVALWLPSSLKAKPPVRYTPVTFRELNTQCERTMRALHHVGVRQGVHVAVMVKPGLEFFSLTFALFQLGALPVLIDPGIGLKALKSCLAEAQPEVFIGIPPAHLARVVLGWGKGSVRTTISVGPSGFWAQHRLDQLIRKTAEHDLPEVTIKPEDRAAILFTSGSTGIPKGVIYEHRNFAAQVRMIRDLYAIEPGEVDLPTFPLFALFSPALGTTSVIPPMDFTRPAKVDPAVLVDAIDQHGVNTMFGSPALLNTLSRWCARRTHRLDGFKRVISPVRRSLQPFCSGCATPCLTTRTSSRPMARPRRSRSRASRAVRSSVRRQRRASSGEVSVLVASPTTLSSGSLRSAMR